MLELTDPMVPLDTSEGVEIHMASDKPGLIMRRRMRESLHGGKRHKTRTAGGKDGANRPPDERRADIDVRWPCPQWRPALFTPLAARGACGSGYGAV
ncbi:hypothetical protein RAA17_15215 [Komagataeibacter rhaeticus]|nr:hypothetical protein [Komagataeibacter rhaeticus]